MTDAPTRLWRYRAEWIPVYAGMTGTGVWGGRCATRPDRSTLSRRVRGVLSPYRRPLHNPLPQGRGTPNSLLTSRGIAGWN